MNTYFVYLLLCADITYYAGVNTDLDRRVREHNGLKKGARYTKTRRPVKLAYYESCENRSLAQKREYELRTLSHSQKEALCSI
jgi:putative endonuclease